MSRRFDASADEVRYPVQASSNFTGAHTIVLVVRFQALVGWMGLVTHTRAGLASALDTGPVVELDDLGQFFYNIQDSVNMSSTGFSINTTHWYMIAVTKASGTVAAKFHWKNLTTNSAWTHANGTAVTHANALSQAGGFIGIGEFMDFDTANMNIAVDAGWASVLSTTDMESLAANNRTQDFVNLHASVPGAYCHQHNQAAAGDDIEDLFGNGHVATGAITSTTDTSGIQGTSIDAASDPPSWVYYTPPPPVLSTNEIIATPGYGQGAYSQEHRSGTMAPRPGAKIRNAARQTGQTEIVVGSYFGSRPAARLPRGFILQEESGLANLVADAADTVTFSDAATRLVTTDRTAADTVLILDAATRIAAFARTASDSISFSDAATVGGVSRPRLATDSVSFSDATTRLVSTARTGSDSVTLSDAAIRVVSRARAGADTVVFSDAAVGIKGTSRDAADTVIFSDAATRAVLSFIRAAADSVVFSDAATRAAIARVRAAADAVSFSDAATRILSLPRLGSDTVAFSDAAARIVSRARTGADSVAFSDAATRIVSRARSGSDTVTLSDAATRASISFVRSASESITFVDEAVVSGQVLNLQRTAADSVTFSDAATRIVSRVRTASDSFTVSDAAVRIVSRARTGSDSIAFDDQATRAAISRVRAAAETISISDAASRAVGRLRVGADSIVFSDQAARGSLGSIRQASDGVSISDFALALLSSHAIASDSWSVGDEAFAESSIAGLPTVMLSTEGKEARLSAVGDTFGLQVAGRDGRFSTIPAEPGSLTSTKA